MKIKMIGTGSMGASSFSSSILIENNILVDLGNGIDKRLKEFGVNPCSIKVILISHLHGDHFADIPFFMFDKFFNDASQKTIIYCPVGTYKKVEELFEIIFPGDIEKVYPNSNVEFREFEKLENEEILPGIFVNSFEVEHGNCKPAYGFTVKSGEKVLGLSGDSKICDGIEKIVSSSDVSVLDMSYVEKGVIAHMGLPDIEELMEKYKDKKIIPTHMHDDTRQTAKVKNLENLVILEDGEEFEF